VKFRLRVLAASCYQSRWRQSHSVGCATAKTLRHGGGGGVCRYLIAWTDETEKKPHYNGTKIGNEIHVKRHPSQLTLRMVGDTDYIIYTITGHFRVWLLSLHPKKLVYRKSPSILHRYCVPQLLMIVYTSNHLSTISALFNLRCWRCITEWHECQYATQTRSLYC